MGTVTDSRCLCTGCLEEKLSRAATFVISSCSNPKVSFHCHDIICILLGKVLERNTIGKSNSACSPLTLLTSIFQPLI